MDILKGLLEYYKLNGSYVMEQFLRHFLISVYGVLFAAVIAIPLGFFIARRKKLASEIISIANIIQTVPSLALLSILMLGLGLGTRTVIATVFLYSILPILSNTYTGVKNVDKNLIDVGKGMGMTKWQLTSMIEIPLSLSMIMAGIRNALVVAIGVTAIGTFIGAGGLGDIISRGVNVSNGSSIILAGALPTAFMALISDLMLGYLEKKINPIK